MIGEKTIRSDWTITLSVMTVAVLARLPAMGSFWNQDDWALLAGASGLIAEPGMAFHRLFETAYWRIMWPLAGLGTIPYAISRIILHALAAGGVVRLAGRMGLSQAQQWIAGLIMAATPLAFASLYWASGVRDLLAVCLAVWAMVLWLGPSPAGRPMGALLAIAAVASKETLAGLPLLMGMLLMLDHTKPGHRKPNWSDWALVAVMLTASLLAAGLTAAYTPGNPLIIPDNLTLYGLWLLLPGPHFPADPDLSLRILGGMLWPAWGAWSIHQWRRGRRTPAIALAGAVLMLAPLLPLTRNIRPDLAYPVEPFGCMVLACLLPTRSKLRLPAAAVMILLAWSWGFYGMQARLSLRDADGLPADLVVRRTAVSASASRHVERLPRTRGGLVILQPPWTRDAARMAEEMGEEWVIGTLLYDSLNGPLGPRLLLATKHGVDPTVSWTNGLRRAPQDAFVMLDMGHDLLPWGMTGQALIYQTLTDLGLGFFDRARLHLLRASLLSGPAVGFAFDPQLLPVPLDRVRSNLNLFLDHLDASRQIGRPYEEIEGLKTNIQRLLKQISHEGNRLP